MFVPVTVIATWLSAHQSEEAKEMLLGGTSSCFTYDIFIYAEVYIDSPMPEC